MKQQIIFLILALSWGGIATAQTPLDGEIDNPKVRDKVKAARVAYITERLGLTTKESQQFWAINNEYETEQDKVRAKYKPSVRFELMSDAEVEQHLRDRFEMEAELLDLKKRYFERFKSVVPARKIALFQKADREFRLELLRKVRERREGRRNRN